MSPASRALCALGEAKKLPVASLRCWRRAPVRREMVGSLWIPAVLVACFCATCTLLNIQLFKNLIGLMPSRPDHSGQSRDRECFAPRHQIGGDHHAPVNTAVNTVRPDHPAFFPDALDSCHRHQSRALVIDHLGSCCRPVVILDGIGRYVGGVACASAAINPAERRVVFRQRVECGSD